MGLKRPREPHLYQVHSLTYVLVYRREPLKKELHEANASQVCYHLGILCILANPSFKPMNYKKCNCLRNLDILFGPLDIIVVVYFQHKNFHLTCLALPNPIKYLACLP
jgi:hypothetical protein